MASPQELLRQQSSPRGEGRWRQRTQQVGVKGPPRRKEHKDNVRGCSVMPGMQETLPAETRQAQPLPALPGHSCPPS